MGEVKGEKLGIVSSLPANTQQQKVKYGQTLRKQMAEGDVQRKIDKLAYTIRRVQEDALVLCDQRRKGTRENIASLEEKVEKLERRQKRHGHAIALAAAALFGYFVGSHASDWIKRKYDHALPTVTEYAGRAYDYITHQTR